MGSEAHDDAPSHARPSVQNRWRAWLLHVQAGAQSPAQLSAALEALVEGEAPAAGRAVEGARAALDALGLDATLGHVRAAPEPVEALAAACGVAWEPDEDVAEGFGAVMRLAGHSPWLGRLAARHRAMRRAVSGPLDTAREAEALTREACALACGDLEGDDAEADDDATLGALRVWRNGQLARAYLRERLDLAPLETTTAEVSALAAACLEAVHQRAWARLAPDERPVDADGAPIPFVIVGLGKLGGWELNLGSDVDLIYAYATDDGSVPARSDDGAWAVHRAFTRHARTITAWMDAVTAQGQLWRVDLRLRPDGQRGPLVQSLRAMEAYYEAWGGTFERIIWLKARPVAGDLALGDALIAQLRPMVYPRSLDMSALEGLRGLKGKIDRHSARQRLGGATGRVRAGTETGATAWPSGAAALLGWDVKLGRGGIREVEFILQALQLVYGGRNPGVRGPNSLATARRLYTHGLLPYDDMEQLTDAYRVLRHVEHALQMDAGRQTHAMPRTFEGLARLARRMSSPPEAFAQRLVELRAQVHARFERLLAAPTPDAEADDPVRRALLRLLDHPTLDPDDAEVRALMTEAGFERPRQSAGQLLVLRSKPYAPFAASATPQLAALGARLLEEAARSADPDLALVHLTDLALRIGARRAYYRVLGGTPAALRLLVSLFGASRYLSRLLIRDPELWGVILGDAAPLGAPWDRTRAASEVKRAWDMAEGLEAKLGALRRAKNRLTLRAVLAERAGLIDVEALGHRLSDIAELCLTYALEAARDEMRAQHGVVRGADGAEVCFGVIALGKLGGRELGVASDLDLIFVYSGPGSADGARQLAAQVYFARLARRLIAFTTTRLGDGPLYAIDTRLRPNGRQGTLVVSLRALERYYAEPDSVGPRSTIWERQALLKARCVATPASLEARVDALLTRALYTQDAARPSADEALRQIAQLRRKLQAQFATSPGGSYNLKAGRGGLLDIEFATQARQWIEGVRCPQVRVRSTPGALRALAQLGCVDAQEAALLERAWRRLRTLEARIRGASGASHDTLPWEDAVAMARLARELDISGEAPGVTLKRMLEQMVDQVRAVCDAWLAGHLEEADAPDPTGARADEGATR